MTRLPRLASLTIILSKLPSAIPASGSSLYSAEDPGSRSSAQAVTLAAIGPVKSELDATKSKLRPVGSTTEVVSAEKPPRISAVESDRRGGIQIIVSGDVGFRYALEASSDCVNWTKVNVRDNWAGAVAFSEPATTNSFRFYRAVSVSKLSVPK